MSSRRCLVIPLSSKSIAQLEKTKTEKVMEGVAYWAAFYRLNPQRFAAEFLNVKLKLFQKITIWCMMHSTNYAENASRGLSKSWRNALYAITKCILYPGTKVLVASGVKSQAIEIITKIQDDFMKNYSWGSDNLCREISYISTSINNAKVEFCNGSTITVATANQNSRHFRATVLIVDEARMVDPHIIRTVLRPTLTTTRQPGYLNNPKYAHLQERNSEMYITSAYYKAHWWYKKTQSNAALMLDDTKQYFCCGFPYELGIKEGLFMREAIEDEQAEADFDAVAFMMEREALFYGATDGAFYSYDDLERVRNIKNAFYTLDQYEKRGVNVPDLAIGERRILSLDVALMATRSHANDASALFINIATPNDNSYASHFVYAETFEGLTTDELGIIIMRYFNHYKCTDLVLDSQGNGLGVADFIAKPQYDPETGETYQAMKSCNDDAMAERCKDKNALKCVWTIKASADFNNNAALALRAGIKNGNVHLLINDYDAQDVVKKVSGYKNMSVQEQNRLLLPYIQTNMTINEMINLEHEIVNNKVKLKERSGMRKDRFSSLEYNYYVTTLLANDLKPKNETMDSILDNLKIRRGSYNGRRI